MDVPLVQSFHLLVELKTFQAHGRFEARQTHRRIAELIDRAAYFIGELNAAHPLCEGNGRTQREFFASLIRECIRSG